MNDRWQAKKEDFGDGWFVEELASSYPHTLEVRVNLFTKEFRFVYLGKNNDVFFADFDEALAYFNEMV